MRVEREIKALTVCRKRREETIPPHTPAVYYHELLLVDTVCPHLLDSHPDLAQLE